MKVIEAFKELIRKINRRGVLASVKRGGVIAVSVSNRQRDEIIHTGKAFSWQDRVKFNKPCKSYFISYETGLIVAEGIYNNGLFYNVSYYWVPFDFSGFIARNGSVVKKPITWVYADGVVQW